MDSSQVGSIIAGVGGKENIANITHCVTRVRFVVKNNDSVDVDGIKAVPGVLDCLFSSGQYQVVVGAGVEDVYREAVKQIGFEASDNGGADVAVPQKKTIGTYAQTALDTLVACFVPAVPLFAGSGMIKVLAVLLSFAGLITTESSSYIILNMIGDAVFYFLPIVVAYNAARKMDVDPILAMVLGMIIMSPTLATLGDAGAVTSFFGLPVTIVAYNAQALPAIFGVWLLKYIDRIAAKVSPKIISVFLRPMISLIVSATIVLVIIGPAANILSNLLFAFCAFMQSWGWLAVGINAVLFPLMVLTGTHNATIPLIVQMFATQGFDPIFLVCGLAANIAESGAACAVAVKTRNEMLKSTGFSASLQALLGITEPALYGVNLRMKRPFFAMLAGAGLGGCLMGLVGLAAPAFVTPSLITMFVFVPAGVNVALALLTIPATFAITFVITYLVGFKDVE